MQGKILDYSVQANTGVISGDDGQRYSFVGSEWKGQAAPTAGTVVDFTQNEGIAFQIYPLPGGALTVTYNSGGGIADGERSKIVAGVFALLFGGLGIHKFYLGFNTAGVIILLTNTVGLFVTMFLCFIPNFILAVLVLIEGIIYLTMSDRDFHEKYVVNKREWL